MNADKKKFSVILNKISKANSDTYIIFYKKTCPYCRNTLQLLREKKVHYKGYDINKIGGTSILLELFNQHKDELKFDPKHKTIPLIFLDGKFIGGYDDLKLKLK
jgi:glutaredoxin